MQEELMTQFRHAAVAAALLAGAGTASAQTTVITPAPVETQTVITEQRPLVLTPVQRQTIYRTIVRERVVPAPPVEYRIGAPVPAGVTLYPVPHDVAVEVPAVEAYKYMVVNGQVVLVDPATSEVVAEVRD
jgi:hypothetical protein